MHANLRICAGWNTFDRIAAAFLGLDRSKYEWAAVERELMERQELEDIANNNVNVAQLAERLERGEMHACAEGSCTALPLACTERMQRPQAGAGLPAA